MVEEVDVEGVTCFSELWFEMVCSVKISLELDVRSFVQCALPTAQQIASRQVGSAESVHLRRGRIQCVCGRFAGALAIDVTLKREGVTIVGVPVCPKPTWPIRHSSKFGAEE